MGDIGDYMEKISELEKRVEDLEEAISELVINAAEQENSQDVETD